MIYYKLLHDSCVAVNVPQLPFSSASFMSIDASMAIYQFLITVRNGGPNQQDIMLMNVDRETMSHIQECSIG
jgi:hypothetical protein